MNTATLSRAGRPNRSRFINFLALWAVFTTSPLARAQTQLMVHPTSLDFGTVVVSASSQEVFTVKNSGTATLNGTASVSGPFAVAAGSPYTVAPGGMTTVAVVFTPTSGGSFTNNMIFASNGGNSTNSVTGVGVVLTPQLVVNPAGLDFGAVAVSTSTQQVFTVKNSGSAILNGTASVSAPFAVAAGSPYTVPPGGMTTVVVVFTPTSGGSFTNNMIFASNGGNSTNSVTGVGVVLTPQLVVNPAGLDFGAVVVSTSSQEVFTVMNSGSATLSGTASVSAPFAVAAGSPYTVAPGGMTTVVVVFTPTSGGSFTNNMIFASNGGNSTNLVIGTGVVLTPQLVVNPAGLDFGAVAVSASSQQVFTVKNSGSAILNGTASVSAPFAVAAGSLYTVPPGGMTTVVVVFTPASGGSFTNNMIFASNGGNSTNLVIGTGFIIAPSVPFQITAIAKLGNDILITWQASVGSTNELQATAGGSNGGYNTNNFIAIFTATNSLGMVRNHLDLGAATNTPARYYRVRLVP